LVIAIDGAASITVNMKNEQPFAASLKIKTAEGDFTAHYSSTGLAQLDFPDRLVQIAPRPTANAQINQWHQLTTRAVRDILAGRGVASFPPMDLSIGTAFQRKVWAAMQAIPAGKTETYAAIAAVIKSPKATRAVGGACGANPIPLLVPCHRVVAAGGKLGGFSGGLHWKQKLLGREISQA
jgi:O-6-methylguanine DNA methyltransferase